jgi:hypothetical protein
MNDAVGDIERFSRQARIRNGTEGEAWEHFGVAVRGATPARVANLEADVEAGVHG